MPVGQRVVDLGITRTWWVPVANATSYPSTITATSLSTAGSVDLTPYLLTDYSVRMDGSDSVNERGIGDLADINVPTIKKYMGSLHMFRSIDPATGLPGTDDPVATFAGNNETGFLVRRIGPSKSLAPAAAQVVEAYKFIADSPQIEAGTGSGFVKVTVPLFSIGVFALATPLT